MYAIKINNTGRYLMWCDDRWYQTDVEPSFVFTREECAKVFESLNSHYVYAITIVGRDGDEEVMDRFASRKTVFSKNGLPRNIEVKAPQKSTGKKSIFKLNASVIKKK